MSYVILCTLKLERRRWSFWTCVFRSRETNLWTHFSLQDTFSSLYISPLPLNACSMETMRCVLLGKAQAKGKWLWSDHSPWRRGEEEDRGGGGKNGKVKHFESEWFTSPQERRTTCMLWGWGVVCNNKAGGNMPLYVNSSLLRNTEPLINAKKKMLTHGRGWRSVADAHTATNITTNVLFSPKFLKYDHTITAEQTQDFPKQCTFFFLMCPIRGLRKSHAREWET